MYLKEIGKVPLLTAAQEVEIAQRMADGDPTRSTSLRRRTFALWFLLPSGTWDAACCFSI
jgi:RNA polymerase primary sigma factor